MKIAMILTNGFDPDPRVYKEAKSLTKLGHLVHIICWDRESKYLDIPEEIIDGIKIVRFFDSTSYGSGYKQGFKFLGFRDKAKKYITENNFDAIHCHDFDGLFIGYGINKKLGIKLTYDEHDLFYMYFADRKGIINKAVYNFIIFQEKRMLRKVYNHIVVTAEMAKLYSKYCKRIYVVNNAPSKDIFKDITKTPSKKLRIGYIGSVRYLEELKALATAAHKFKDKVEVIISGGGIVLQELKEFCGSLENVTITGPYKMEQLEELYKGIDVTYAFYPSKISSISMPNKFYESIITETPIIANRMMEFGQEVEKHNIGYSISDENLESDLERIISELLNDGNKKNEIIENMRRMKDQYLWEANEKKLEEIYSF